jgi:hypothetical protein
MITRWRGPGADGGKLAASPGRRYRTDDAITTAKRTACRENPRPGPKSPANAGKAGSASGLPGGRAAGKCRSAKGKHLNAHWPGNSARHEVGGPSRSAGISCSFPALAGGRRTRGRRQVPPSRSASWPTNRRPWGCRCLWRPGPEAPGPGHHDE